MIRSTVSPIGRKKRTIRRASPRRARQLRAYAALAKTYLFEHPVCEVCRKTPSGQIHHVGGRIGNQLNITRDWLAICQPCHDRIHAHGAWAREQGFLK
jgi:hypothetical protein